MVHPSSTTASEVGHCGVISTWFFRISLRSVNEAWFIVDQIQKKTCLALRLPELGSSIKNVRAI